MTLITDRGQSPDAKTSGTQAIERALAIFDLFRGGKSDLSVTEVASALGLRPSTAHRILQALVRSGYIEQRVHSEKYHLGRSAVLLGLAAERSLGLQAVMPVLEGLGRRTSESINMGVRDGHNALVLLHVASSMALRFEQPAGTRITLHASSVGKALLAFSSDVEQYLEVARAGLASFTDFTITDVETLGTELVMTRERGYSVDNEESIAGVRCLGVPVLDAKGCARAAVAIQGPSIRMSDERLEALVPLLRDAAAEISQLLPSNRLL